MATTAYISASTDAGAALAPLLSGGTRVRHWQSARRLQPDTRRLQLPLDDCCRLVLPYNAVHSIQQTEQIPNDPPQMGTKSTTTSNHPSTVGLRQRSDYIDMYVVKSLGRLRELAEHWLVVTRYFSGLATFTRSAPFSDVYIHTMPSKSCIDQRLCSPMRRMA